MADSAVSITTGMTVGFGTSSYSAELIDFSWGDISREAVETTHMGTAAAGANEFGNKTFIPTKTSNPGVLSLEFHFNPATDIIIDAVAEVITITFASGTTWVGSGFCLSWDVTGPLEDKMTCSATFQMSDSIFMTDAT